MARNSKLKKLRLAVNKEHGKGALGIPSRVVLQRLTTGSLSFDRALGGGLPVGRTIIFRGSESSGKTTAAYRCMGVAQDLCANCLRPVNELKFVDVGDGEREAVGECDCYAKGLFAAKQYPDEKADEYKERIARYKTNSYEEFRVALVDPEGSWDVEWAERLGVDPTRLLYICPDSAEEAGDVYDEVLRTGEIDLIVLDSIAMMTPSVEIEKSLVEQQQGLQARIFGKFTRKVVAATNTVVREYGRLPTQLWINQERQKIGISFGDNTVLPAGLAQLFAASVIVKMWASKWQREVRDDDLIKEHQTEIASKVRMNFKVTKNKTAPAMQTGSYELWIAGDKAGEIDELKYFVAMAEKFGLYKDEGKGTKRRWIVGDEEYKTLKAAMARLQEPAVYQAMRAMMLKKLLVY